MSRLFIALVLLLASLVQLAVLCDPAIASGERVLTYQLPFSYVDQSPAIGDLEGCGKQDIVINVMCGTIIALNGSFDELWRWDDHSSDENTLPPTIADLNGDGKPEVLSLMMSGRLVCLEGKTGHLLWSAKLPSAVNLGTAVVVAADLEGDGKRDVLATDSKDTMTCFNAEGEVLWKFTDEAGLNTIPAAGDLYGDGKMEVVTGAPGAIGALGPASAHPTVNVSMLPPP